MSTWRGGVTNSFRPVHPHAAKATREDPCPTSYTCTLAGWTNLPLPAAPLRMRIGAAAAAVPRGAIARAGASTHASPAARLRFAAIAFEAIEEAERVVLRVGQRIGMDEVSRLLRRVQADMTYELVRAMAITVQRGQRRRGRMRWHLAHTDTGR